MRRTFFLWILMWTAISPGRAEEVDGFAVMVELSESMTAILETRDRGLSRDLALFLREGGEMPPAVAELRPQVKPLLDRLREASTTTVWTPLDKAQFDPAWEVPVSVGGWLGLSNFAALEIRLLMEQEAWEEALSLLAAFEPYDAYLLRNGTLLMPILAHGSRQLRAPQRLLLARRLPVELLEQDLTRQLRFLTDLPPPAVQLEGEFAMGPNLVNQIFDRMMNDEADQQAREELLAALRAHPDGARWADKWETRRTTLELQQLRAQVLGDLTRFQNLLLQMESAEMPPLADWSDLVRRHMDGIMTEKQQDEFFDLAFLNQLGPDLKQALEAGEDLAAVLDLFERRLRRTLLQVTLPSGEFGLFRNQLALERLMAVHLAGELLHRRTGAFPDRLQLLAEAELLPGELLSDPHSGGIFLLTRVNGRWHPYSTGNNRRDNGGRNFREDVFIPLFAPAPLR